MTPQYSIGAFEIWALYSIAAKMYRYISWQLGSPQANPHSPKRKNVKYMNSWCL